MPGPMTIRALILRANNALFPAFVSLSTIEFGFCFSVEN